MSCQQLELRVQGLQRNENKSAPVCRERTQRRRDKPPFRHA